MNYPFFIAGILSILFAVIHEMLGEKFVFFEFKKNPISKNIYNKIFTSWVQVTASFLVIGAALTYISFLPHLNRRDFAPFLILLFLVVDFLIFISVLASRQKEKLIASTPQIILYIIIILLISLGIMM